MKVGPIDIFIHSYNPKSWYQAWGIRGSYGYPNTGNYQICLGWKNIIIFVPKKLALNFDWTYKKYD